MDAPKCPICGKLMANNDRTSSGEYRCTVHAYSQSQLDIYIKKAGMDLSLIMDHLIGCC